MPELSVTPEVLCPFCRRPIIRMMRHHTVPKSLGGKEKMDSCRDCHRAIHLCFTNRELEKEFNTVKKLLSRAKFRRMVEFIKGQDPYHKVRMLRPQGARRKRW